MAIDQFQKGVSTIKVAIEAALQERGVIGGAIQHNARDKPQDAQFSLTVDGRKETQDFALQEIEDSAEAIDAPAAAKVRMLVSPFVRAPK